MSVNPVCRVNRLVKSDSCRKPGVSKNIPSSMQKFNEIGEVCVKAKTLTTYIPFVVNETYSLLFQTLHILFIQFLVSKMKVIFHKVIIEISVKVSFLLEFIRCIDGTLLEWFIRFLVALSKKYSVTNFSFNEVAVWEQQIIAHISPGT